jgi:hypothetical protein
MWRKSISCTLSGVMIIGSAGLVVLGLKGYWEPGVPFALALIFGFGMLRVPRWPGGPIRGQRQNGMATSPMRALLP